jgi:hypothetical protein
MSGGRSEGLYCSIHSAKKEEGHMRTRYIFSLTVIILFALVSISALAADDLATIANKLDKRKADLKQNQEAKADLERFLDPDNNYFFLKRSDRIVAMQLDPDKIRQDVFRISYIQALIIQTQPITYKALVDAKDFWDMLAEDNKDIRSQFERDYETIKNNIMLAEGDIRRLEEKAAALAATRKAQSQAAAAPLEPPRIWKECEDSNVRICGTWTYNADNETLEAKWDNGARATLKLRKFDGKEVKITRNDMSGASKGLQAHYTGRITPTGVVDGKVTWSWGGRTWSGTWKADW